MRPSKSRYQLWQIMLAIAVLAGLFAAFGVTGAVAIVVVTGVTVLPIPLAGPGRRIRAMVWITSIYPLLIIASFYATWLTAWCILGHRPRGWLDDPGSISPIVDVVRAVPVMLIMLGTPLVWFVHAPVILAMVYWNMAERKTPVGKGVMQLLIPLLAWVSLFVILSSDPGSVINWYYD